MPVITPVTWVRFIGVVLGIIFMAHYVHGPYLVIAGASLALLFLP